jgi:hypothetical protein
MARHTTPIVASQRRIKFPNGTELDVAPFVGTATQWTGEAAGFRRLPAEEDLSPQFRNALREVGVIEQESLHLDVSPAATAATGRRAAVSSDNLVLRPKHSPGLPEGVNVVLYQDEAGGLSWHFPDGFFDEASQPNAPQLRSRLRAASAPAFSIPTRTHAARRVMVGRCPSSHLRGPITKIGRKIFKVLLLPILEPLAGPPLEAIVGRVERKFRQELIRSVTPDNYRSQVTDPFQNWSALNGQRSLLVVHGILSSTNEMLSCLPKSAMEELHRHYGGRVIAFDQITVSRSPEDNARHFLETLRRQAPTGRFDFDILCHSRGGIVSRTLVERGSSLVPRPQRLVRQGVFRCDTEQWLAPCRPRTYRRNARRVHQPPDRNPRWHRRVLDRDVSGDCQAVGPHRRTSLARRGVDGHAGLHPRRAQQSERPATRHGLRRRRGRLRT